MKVLHIIASVDRRSGGPVEGVFLSSAVWWDHGHVRHILSLDPSDAACVLESPIPTFAVGPTGKGIEWLRRIFPLMRYAYSPRLISWLDTNVDQYDAVIVNGIWNYASLGAWRGLRKRGVPYFVFIHGMLDPWFNRAYPIKTFFKSIYWRLFEHRTLRDARGVMFTCEEERLSAATSFAPYRAREYVVGYGTRDPSGDPTAQRAAFWERSPQLKGRRFLLFLGRIHEKKGLDLLVEGFARHAADHPEVDLAVAGPDQSGLVAGLKRRAETLGVAARIHWLGMLTGDAKWGAFRAAEAFVLPSHQENFGIAVAEALAMGKPALITNKVNIWREVEADGAGVSVNDDVDGVTEGVGRLLRMTDEEREAMARNARHCFEARYDLKYNAMTLLELMQSVISVEAG